MFCMTAATALAELGRFVPALVKSVEDSLAVSRRVR